MTFARIRTAAATLTLLAAGSAQAQGAEPWRFQLALYGWVPAISGQSEFLGNPSSIGISMGDVLDNLKMTFQGTFEASRGRWGLYTDFFYGNLGHAKTANHNITIGNPPIPATVTGTLDVDVKNYFWTLAGTYNLITSDDYRLDLLAGARMFRQEERLSYDLTVDIVGPGGVIPKQGTRTGSLTNWDAIVGVRGNASFGPDRRFILPYHFDIGTGESKLTYQAFVGIGYRFDWGAAVAGWRYLDYDFKSGEALQEMTYNGPLAGVAFRF
jgi:hypothetical protein